MSSLTQEYKSVFSRLGFPLTTAHAVDKELLRVAEKTLGIRLPPALRDYYRVAGHEACLNQQHNRLLAPHEWRVEQSRLIFMAENQCVVWWGVDLRKPENPDPMVYQGIDDETWSWHSEYRPCSQFLSIMLHYQAVNGGCPACGSCYLKDRLTYQFRRHGWTYQGTLNGMKAYSRQGQVVCRMPPGSHPPFDFENGSIYAGAGSKASLNDLGRELGLDLQ